MHVVDASREDWPDQADAVFGVLEQLGADEKPMLTVFNKVDRVADQAGLRRLVAETPHSVGISALNGRGLPALLEGIEEMLAVKMVPVAVLLPYQRGDLVALCYERGRVRVREDRPDGVYLEVDLPQGLAGSILPPPALATRAARLGGYGGGAWATGRTSRRPVSPTITRPPDAFQGRHLGKPLGNGAIGGQLPQAR